MARILKIVLIKFIAPKIEDTPAKCKEKIAQSTEGPECARFPLRGGYTVQPVPAPASTTLLKSSMVRAGIKNQTLYYLIEETPYLVHQSLKVLTNFRNRQSG